MEIRYERQLKRGVLEILVLKIISEDKTYGYQLITQLDKRSGSLFKIKEGTLYPILYRLEDDGMICSEWSAATEKNLSKKYYEITALGVDTLRELTDLWKQYDNCINRLLSE